MLAADLEELPGFDARILPVSVVDLQLNEFHIRVLGQQFFQKFRVGMERETVVLDDALRFQFFYIIPEVIIFIFLIIESLYRVQEIVIKVARIGSLQRSQQFLLGCLFVIDVW